MKAAEHPLVMKKVAALKQLQDMVEAAIEALPIIAGNLPRKCPMPEDVACACTGYCYLPEHAALISLAADLKAALDASKC